MPPEEREAAWTKKGGTLSVISAQKEFGVTEQEIIKAIRAGKLQYRVNYIYENPYFKLIRREVEALVRRKHGEGYLKKQKLKKELANINKALKKLKAQVTSLEQRRKELLGMLAE